MILLLVLVPAVKVVVTSKTMNNRFDGFAKTNSSWSGCKSLIQFVHSKQTQGVFIWKFQQQRVHVEIPTTEILT